MDPISFGIGVISLAGLFSTCVDCFDLVQRGRYLGRDYLLLETKFANQKLRFMTWGRACGMMSSDGYDGRLDSEDLKPRIQDTLLHLLMLFKDGTNLKRKYGLKEDRQTINSTTSGVRSIAAAAAWDGGSLSQRFQEVKCRMQKTRKQASIVSSAKWAIDDKRKFTELVQHLKDLIDDLEGLTKGLDIVARQREMIKDELESISEIPILETMEEARLGHADAVSAAASLRLWRLRDQYLPDSGADEAATGDFMGTNSPAPTTEGWDLLSDASEHAEVLGDDVSYQVLHEVRCGNDASSHLFLDRPSYFHGQRDAEQWALLNSRYPTVEEESYHLSGRRHIPNLQFYLKQNCTLNFVVFHHYHCCDAATHLKGPAHLPVGQSIRLLSKRLCASLQKLCQTSFAIPDVLNFESETGFKSPYLWFYQSKALIIQAKMELEATDADLVNPVFEVMNDYMDGEYGKVDSLLSKKTIIWRYIRYLYVPNEVLLAPAPKKRREHDRAYEPTTWPTVFENGHTITSIKIPVQSWDLNGCFQKVYTSIDISQADVCTSNDEVLQICSLPLFPLRYAAEKVKQDLENRGRVFWQMRNPQYVAYSGMSADSDQQLHGRFIIDANGFRTSKQDSQPAIDSHTRTDDLSVADMARSDPPEGNFVLLLPPVLLGYDLQRKQCVQLNVTSIYPVEWQKHALESLVIKPSIKVLLLALLSNKTISKNSFGENFVAGKGGGLVLLFHGNPGTGKTLAAECVAESIEKPLFRINIAELRDKTDELEWQISRALNAEKAWGCVLLLDDADLILEESSVHDMGANAMVTIFTRLLDDLSGTLILTTNRVELVNQALRSRINLAIYFQPLQQVQRLQIWKTLLTMDYPEHDILDHVEDLAVHKMNGRQIRNTLLVAQKLASYQQRRLTYETLQEVIAVSDNFDNHKKMLPSFTLPQSL